MKYIPDPHQINNISRFDSFPGFCLGIINETCRMNIPGRATTRAAVIQQWFSRIIRPFFKANPTVGVDSIHDGTLGRSSSLTMNK